MARTLGLESISTKTRADSEAGLSEPVIRGAVCGSSARTDLRGAEGVASLGLPDSPPGVPWAGGLTPPTSRGPFRVE